MEKQKKLIIFHPLIAPYRLDLFNDMATKWNASIYLVYRRYWRFKNYDRDIRSKFKFTPQYIYPEGKEKGAGHFSFRYWKIIHKENPDYILVWEFGTMTLLAILYKYLFANKIKIITFCDDSPAMLSLCTFKHKIARNILSKFVDNIILASPITVEWFNKKFNKGIYFPIIRNDEIARKYLYDEKINEYSSILANELSLKQKNIFLFVGRLDPEKNVTTLLHAFFKISNSEKDILLIVGNGSKEEEYKNFIKYNNIKNILLLGRKEGKELIAIYNLADIFILPSFYDPFGAVTNEALLYGCFSIISNKAGSSCLIENDQNGFLFSPNAEDELCKLLINSKNKIKRTQNYLPKPNLMLDSYKNLFNKLTIKLFNEK